MKNDMINKTIHAFTDDVLGFNDATGIAELIRNREISAREVRADAIARATKVNNNIEAIAFECFEKKPKNPRRYRRGFFRGVPSFLKDNADLKGMPTKHGSAATPWKIYKKNSPFADLYRRLGFTLLGKSRMPEFGLNATTEFKREKPCRNPWNTDYSSGGSSGGAAALVSAGVVPLAHGNDGGGSIRIPAACCGLVGLKATRGRFINSKTSRALPVNIVSDGVLTRSVRDTARFIYEMEKLWHNKKLPYVGHITAPGTKRLRIGLVSDSVGGIKSCPETRSAVEDTAKLLESMGHQIEPVSMPITEQFIDDFTLYWSMLAFLLSKTGKVIFSKDFNAERLEPFTQGLVSNYQKNYMNTPGIIHRLKKSAADYAEGIKGYDAVLSPVLAHTIPELGYLEPNNDFDTVFNRLKNYVAFTPLNNATGSPAISLPLGADSKGMPIGIQFQAAHGMESLLLMIAYELEEARPFRKIYETT